MRRVFDMVQNMMRYRGYTIDSTHSVFSNDRGKFRVYASTDTLRVVALFFDFTTVDARRGRWSSTHVTSPSSDTMQIVVAIADKETSTLLGGTGKKLIVLMLRSDDSQQLKKNEQMIIDTNNNKPNNTKLLIEVWHVKELAYDVIAHCEVATHRRATLIEQKKLGDNVNHLPLLLCNDPVAKWLGFVPGEVICELRQDAKIGAQHYFRMVVRVS